MTPLTPDEQAIKDIGEELLALQRKLYLSPLRNRQLKKVMGFKTTVEIADKIAVAAAEVGMTRSQWLRELVTAEFTARAVATKTTAIASKIQSKTSESLEF